MIKRLIAGKEPTGKDLFFWNMIGSAIYALASMVLTYMTIRVIGENDGGIFGIALTLAQMFIYIAYYEMRNFQVTDAEDKYEFSQYNAVKVINCIVMMLVCGLYILMKGYDTKKALIVFLVCLYRMLDGYSDVYESEFHARGRLDLAGKSMAFRTVISVGVYFGVLITTHDLLRAVIWAIISGIVGIVIFNILIFDSVGKISFDFRLAGMISIWKDCFPLFIGMFLWTYLLSASRIAVDNVMASEYQSYYQVLFLPVSVINLMAGFLIRPSLIELTELCSKGELKNFWSRILKMMGILGGFTVLCMGGAYLLGIPVLEILVNCELDEYRWMFVFLIFAGGINAIGYVLYYVLTILRSRKGIIAGYGIASVVAWFISDRFTEKWGLWGASISYLVAIFTLIIVFAVVVAFRNGDMRRNLSQ